MNAMPETTSNPARRAGEAFAASSPAGSRYPFLDDVCEQAAKRYADEIRRTIPSAFFTAAGIEKLSLGDAVEGAEGSAIAVVFRVPEWNAHVVVKLNRACVMTMTEILFGGDGAEPAHAEERPFSGLEMRVARSVATQFAKALEGAFGPAALDPAFKFERVESRLEFALMARRGDPAVAAKFRMKALGRTGLILVTVPQVAVDLMLGREHADADAGGRRDADWTRHMGAEVRRSAVQLSAILEERPITLGEIAGWKVGEVLPLRAGPQSLVTLACEQNALVSCELGQAEGAYTLRVADVIEEREFLDVLLAR